MPTFEEMNLSAPVLRAVIDMGFEETTPIQERTIPLAMSFRDLIGQAQTGTGKTAAFGIPMIEKMNQGQDKIMGLVVTPTRELAVQVAEEINTIGKHKGVRALPIYGGQDINRQIRALKNKPQIVVGPPGRLMDHMRRKTLRLQEIVTVVLDEADEMLNMGFIEDIETILSEVPKERQTMLFSATMPKTIQDLAKRFMSEAEFVSVRSKEVTVPNTEQNYLEVPERQKFDVLCRLLDIQSPDLAIIFGRTKKRVDELFEGLTRRGYSAEAIHGDLSQPKRENVLRHFRDGTTEILVATDVAARGLDIGGVTHIYNFDIPRDPEGYVHRIGRTGRLGQSGMAVTFVTQREEEQLRLIEKTIKRKIAKIPVPTMNEAIEGQQRLAVAKLRSTMGEEDTCLYKSIADELLHNNDAAALLSAALKLLTKEPDRKPVKITEETPPMPKRPKYDDRNRSSDRYTGALPKSRPKYEGNKGQKKNYKKQKYYQ